MTAVREPVARPEPRARPRQPWLSRRRLPYLLIAPAILFELLIHVIPLLAGVGISFLGLTQFFIRNWTPAPFSGLGNYRHALDFGGPIGEGLLHSFLITAAFTVVVVALAWAMGMLAAQLVNTEFRGQRWFRTLFLVPYAAPVYISVIAWSFLLDRDNGALNALLGDLHLIGDEPPFWLIGTNAFWAIVMTTVWRLWPFAFLMILAGMQSIPGELYEAAEVDGASAVAPLPPHHAAAAAARHRGAADHPLPLDLQRVQHGLRAVRPRAALVGGPAVAAHLRQLVREPELRPRLGDVGAAAAVPAAGDDGLHPDLPRGG